MRTVCHGDYVGEVALESDWPSGIAALCVLAAVFCFLQTVSVWIRLERTLLRWAREEYSAVLRPRWSSASGQVALFGIALAACGGIVDTSVFALEFGEPVEHAFESALLTIFSTQVAMLSALWAAASLRRARLDESDLVGSLLATWAVSSIVLAAAAAASGPRSVHYVLLAVSTLIAVGVGFVTRSLAARRPNGTDAGEGAGPGHARMREAQEAELDASSREALLSPARSAARIGAIARYVRHRHETSFSPARIAREMAGRALGRRTVALIGASGSGSGPAAEGDRAADAGAAASFAGAAARVDEHAERLVRAVRTQDAEGLFSTAWVAPLAAPVDAVLRRVPSAAALALGVIALWVFTALETDALHIAGCLAGVPRHVVSGYFLSFLLAAPHAWTGSRAIFADPDSSVDEVLATALYECLIVNGVGIASACVAAIFSRDILGAGHPPAVRESSVSGIASILCAASVVGASGLAHILGAGRWNALVAASALAAFYGVAWMG